MFIIIFLLERRNKTKYKSQRESYFLFLQFAYLCWESLLTKLVANQHNLFNCDEQCDVV